MKNRHSLVTSKSCRWVEFGKSTSAKEKGKVLSSFTSKSSGYDFDVQGYNIFDFVADDHVSYLSSVVYDPSNSFPRTVSPSLITTAFFPLSVTPTTRETVEWVVHRCKQVAEHLNKRPASTIVDHRFNDGITTHGDTSVAQGVDMTKVATIAQACTSHLNPPIVPPSTATAREGISDRDRAGTEEVNALSRAVTSVPDSAVSSVPSHTEFSRPSSSTRPSDRTSDIMIAQEIVPSSLPLDQEDAPDLEDPALTDEDEDDALGVGEVDLLADPACWRPFPLASQILRKDGKTIGFRTKSGISFGPERIEIRPDASGQQWVFRFITHDYSIPVETSVSRRARNLRCHRDLDAYLMSLDESLRSHCGNDSTFKDLPNAKFAMEVRIPPDSILERDEFKDRELLWTSFVTSKNCSWPQTSSYAIKLRNESLDDLHRVLYAPILKVNVAQSQLMFDVHLLTQTAARKDLEARKDLACAIGSIAQLTLLAADQTETIKFLPGGKVATHLGKITSGLSAIPNNLERMLYRSLRRFYEARLEARQEVFRGFEQNVRVMELMKSSPFCRLLFPTSVVKETLQTMKNSPLGMHAFFRKNRTFAQSSNLPFRMSPKTPTKQRPKKSPAKKSVVFHSRWTKSSQPRAGFKSDSGKSPAKSKTPFRGRKGGPYKGRGRGGTR